MGPAGGVPGTGILGVVRVDAADGEDVGLALFRAGPSVGSLNRVPDGLPAAVGFFHHQLILLSAGHLVPCDLDAVFGILQTGDSRTGHKFDGLAGGVKRTGVLLAVGSGATDTESIGHAAGRSRPGKGGAGGVAQSLPTGSSGLDHDLILDRTGDCIPIDPDTVGGILKLLDARTGNVLNGLAGGVKCTGVGLAVGSGAADGKSVGLAGLCIRPGIGSLDSIPDGLPAGVCLDHQLVLFSAGNRIPGQLHAVFCIVQLRNRRLGNLGVTPS